MSLSVAIKHRFAGFEIDAAFEAPAGITALFGRSGAGKTTVVNAVSGLLRPNEGRVVVDGETLLDTERHIAVPVHRRRIGYVFQEGRLFPHMTVRQNLAFGRWFAPKHAPAENMNHVVELLGIGHLLARRPVHLSGGEKQRVAIGRALLSAPRLLLMDEPLASLDEERKADILPYIERLSGEVRIPVLYVSHSISEVARLATTIVIMREGKVLRAGPADELLADPGVLPALGRHEAGAVLTACCERHHDDGMSELSHAGGALFLPKIDARSGDAVRLRIRASDIMLSLTRPEDISALNILAVTVDGIHPGEGPGVAVALQAGNDRLLARLTRRSVEGLRLTEGMQVFAVVKSMAVARSDVNGSVADSRQNHGRVIAPLSL